jgi:hypothetical protein
MPTDISRHRYGIQARKQESSRADLSENKVLLAFIMACWQWLTSPPKAAAWKPGYPPMRPALAAIPAARPQPARSVLLAPVHSPWRLRSSPPLA